MSELCGCAAAEQPTFDKILGRLEHIKRETLIDGEPGKPGRHQVRRNARP